MSFSFDNISDLTKVKEHTTEILAVLILLSFTFLYYKAFYVKNHNESRKLSAEVGQIRSDIGKIKAEIKATGTLKTRLDETSLALGRVEREILSISEQLPHQKELSNIISELTRVRAAKSINFLAIKPLAPVGKGKYIQLPFHLSIEGRYFTFGNYLESLERLERVITIDNFKISDRGKGSSDLGIELYISAYNMK